MSLTLPTTTPNGESLVRLCGRARPELAALGELGVPLLGVLAAIEQTGGERGVDALADPGFALEVLNRAAGASADPAVVGRVLDHLRNRAPAGLTAGAAQTTAPRSAVTVADAVASYEAGALTLLASTTQAMYRGWARRLVAEHGAEDPNQVTTGDLKDLIAHWVAEARLHNTNATRDGGSVEASAVTAYRHLWAYLVDKGWAEVNIAQGLRKPPPDDPNRRPFRPEEAALVRHLVRGLGRDEADQVIVALEERLGLRAIELRRLRLRDVHLNHRPRPDVRVYGKGNKYRDMPIGPDLAGLLERYVELVRPRHIDPRMWAHSDDAFLRTVPSGRWPQGRPVNVADRLYRLFKALRAAAPELFAAGDLTPHCYRHALATFVDGRYGRAVTKAVLGHKGRRTPTDHYVHVDPETIYEAISTYEAHLLAADPITNGDGTGEGADA